MARTTEILVATQDGQVHRAYLSWDGRTYTTAQCTGLSSGVTRLDEYVVEEADPEKLCRFCWPRLDAPVVEER